MLDNQRLFLVCFSSDRCVSSPQWNFERAREPARLARRWAVCVSLGLISIWFVAKNCLELRKYFNNDSKSSGWRIFRALDFS
jgi:hypothetical protein